MAYTRRRSYNGRNAECFACDMQAEKAATRLLRKNGFTWSGRDRDGVDTNQVEFDSSLISTPTGGKPGRRKSHL